MVKLVDENLQEELESHDFDLVKEEKSESFDNELLVFKSEDLRVRITRDRGDVFDASLFGGSWRSVA